MPRQRHPEVPDVKEALPSGREQAFLLDAVIRAKLGPMPVDNDPDGGRVKTARVSTLDDRRMALHSYMPTLLGVFRYEAGRTVAIVTIDGPYPDVDPDPDYATTETTIYSVMSRSRLYPTPNYVEKSWLRRYSDTDRNVAFFSMLKDLKLSTNLGFDRPPIAEVLNLAQMIEVSTIIGEDS